MMCSNKDITNTRRPIIYPSGKIIAHDSRYVYNVTYSPLTYNTQEDKIQNA